MSCLVRSSLTTLGHAPVQSPFGAARGAVLGPVPHGTPSSVQFGSVRFLSSPVISFILLVSIDPVSIVMSCLGHVPVSVTVRRRSRGGPRSGPGGAVARRLGQVPAERSLDASVRYLHGTCHVLSGPCARLCHRSAPLAGAGLGQVPAERSLDASRLGPVRSGSVRIGPLQLLVPFIN